MKLSGGEKQRVAIARAFLRDPALLICDEATSALDSATENGIMQSLKELSTGRTSIFVAHRLSTVKHCDTIFVMKAGRVVEEGTHAYLVGKKGGVYARMWDLQQQEEEEDGGGNADGENDADGGNTDGGGHGGGHGKVVLPVGEDGGGTTTTATTATTATTTTSMDGDVVVLN